MVKGEFIFKINLFCILCIFLVSINSNFVNSDVVGGCQSYFPTVFTTSFNCNAHCGYINHCECLPAKEVWFCQGDDCWMDDGTLFKEYNDCYNGNKCKDRGCQCYETTGYYCEGDLNWCGDKSDGSYCSGNTKFVCKSNNIETQEYCACGCEEKEGGDITKSTYATCMSCPECGDGIIHTSNGEVCDSGANNIPITQYNASKKCMDDCQWVPSYCGDDVCDTTYETYDNSDTTKHYCPNDCSNECRLSSSLKIGLWTEKTDFKCDEFKTSGACTGFDDIYNPCEWDYSNSVCILSDSYAPCNEFTTFSDCEQGNMGICSWDQHGSRCLSVAALRCFELYGSDVVSYNATTVENICAFKDVGCNEFNDHIGRDAWEACEVSNNWGSCSYCCEEDCEIKNRQGADECFEPSSIDPQNYTIPFYRLNGVVIKGPPSKCISEFILNTSYCNEDYIQTEEINCWEEYGTTCSNGRCVAFACPPETPFPNSQKTGYTGTKTTIFSNDYPLNIADYKIHTCCNSTTSCVQNVSSSFICRAETYKLTYGDATDYTHICDDGMWVDFDSTQQNCEAGGWSWAPGGVSFAGTSSSGTVVTRATTTVPQVGEYNILGEMECCGDDDNEVVVSTYCPNSETNNVPTCCPDNTYKLINGQCVKDCPSIERTAKVVIDAPSDALLAKRISDLLKSENESLGCYPSTDTCSNFVVNLAPIHIPSPTPYAYCADGQGVFKSGKSDDTVITDTTTTSKSYPITNCEKTQFCVEGDVYSETLNPIPGDLENFLVFTKGTTTKGLVKYDDTKFTVNQKEIATYKTGTNCIPTNCEVKEILVVEDETCYPTCEINSSDCFITCLNAGNLLMHVYDGPGCTLTGDSCEVRDLVIEDYTVTKGLVAPRAIDDPSVDNGRTPGDHYKVYSTSFSVEDFCVPSKEACIEEAICVSPKATNIKGTSVDQKMKIYDFYGNEYVQAVVSSHASVTGGEYWCPDGYELAYESTLKEYYCKSRQNVCAWGTTEHLTPNCDWSNMLNGEDVWGLYNEECFYDTDTSTPDQYEDSCCYSTSYGDIQVYETTSVKVY